MKDVLFDIASHTAMHGWFEHVNVKGTKNTTEISAENTDEKDLGRLMLYANAKAPVPELIDAHIGLDTLSFLKRIAQCDPMRRKDVTIKLTRNDRNKPCMIEFSTGNEINVGYRLAYTAGDLRAFKGTNWNIQFHPDEDKVAEFNEIASLFGDIKSDAEQFTMKTDNGGLKFLINQGEWHKAAFVFEANVPNKFDEPTLLWPVELFLQVLNLAYSEKHKFFRPKKPELKISERGVACIEFESELVEYMFLIFANLK